MPTTASGIYYPSLSDAPDVPGRMQAMADSIEPFIAKPYCKLILPSDWAVGNNNNALSAPFGSGSELAKSHAGMHSTTVNNTRITPTIAGWYRFHGAVTFAPNNTGFRTIAVGKNGARQMPEVGVYASAALASGGNTSMPVVVCELFMNGTTDYAELFAFQNITGGGTLAAKGDGNTGTTGNTWFSCEYIRPAIP